MLNYIWGSPFNAGLWADASVLDLKKRGCVPTYHTPEELVVTVETAEGRICLDDEDRCDKVKYPRVMAATKTCSQPRKKFGLV